MDLPSGPDYGMCERMEGSRRHFSLLLSLSSSKFVFFFLVFFHRERTAWRGDVWEEGENTTKLPTVLETNVSTVQESLRDPTDTSELMAPLP